jgi:hypothetical protein
MSLVLNSGFSIGPGVVLDAGYTPPPPVPTIVTVGLVLHYDFSDPVCYSGGVTVNDLSTANNEGSVANAYGHVSYVSSGTNSYFNWDSNAGGNDVNSFGSSIFTESADVYRDFTIILQPDFTMSGMGGVICVPGDKSLRVYNNGWAFPNPGNGDDWAADSGGATTYYVNGQASNQLLSGWNIIGGATTNPAFLTPNQLYIGTSGYGGRHMQGKIALVLMYNRALTEQEQLQNYSILRARFGL